MVIYALGKNNQHRHSAIYSFQSYVQTYARQSPRIKWLTRKKEAQNNDATSISIIQHNNFSAAMQNPLNLHNQKATTRGKPELNNLTNSTSHEFGPLPHKVALWPNRSHGRRMQYASISSCSLEQFVVGSSQLAIVKLWTIMVEEPCRYYSYCLDSCLKGPPFLSSILSHSSKVREISGSHFVFFVKWEPRINSKIIDTHQMCWKFEWTSSFPMICTFVQLLPIQM